ncbi:MAG TPA: MBL fold metallo-hydrolase [Gemmatimonadales bacterium]|nr:MBL fold metallo-hydrolase [Gemmatimonadales bacterium]
MALEIVCIPNGQFAQNCYLAYDPQHPEAVLIDPGEEPERFLAAAAQQGRRISAIWLTHAHLDHILGVGEIHAATGAPIALHPGDRELYDGLPQQGLWMDLRLTRPPPPAAELVHGQRLTIGSIAIEVRHVPGHSPGHVCFVAPGAVLSGDVLFEGSIGRTDLPGGDFDSLIASIRRELLSLPDDTVVYPGHGAATTIGRERRTNPFLR